jgi:hypothetical protein
MQPWLNAASVCKRYSAFAGFMYLGPHSLGLEVSVYISQATGAWTRPLAALVLRKMENTHPDWVNIKLQSRSVTVIPQK